MGAKPCGTSSAQQLLCWGVQQVPQRSARRPRASSLAAREHSAQVFAGCAVAAVVLDRLVHASHGCSPCVVHPCMLMVPCLTVIRERCGVFTPGASWPSSVSVYGRSQSRAIDVDAATPHTRHRHGSSVTGSPSMRGAGRRHAGCSCGARPPPVERVRACGQLERSPRSRALALDAQEAGKHSRPWTSGHHRACAPRRRTGAGVSRIIRHARPGQREPGGWYPWFTRSTSASRAAFALWFTRRRRGGRHELDVYRAGRA